MVYLAKRVKFLQSISCGLSVIAYRPVCLCGVLPRWTTRGSSINLGRSYAKNASSSKIVSNMEDIKKIRNIGIMAHIDAGKTTTTERMLYYSGFSKHLGNVNSGDTVTDYMIQERERGITIMSAAITFNWKQHRINLIDTPGHVDFTLEVERCLRVLDGAVTVLDASAGVEAQTLTVWRQADRYGVPRIIFLNKMDKTGADFYGSLDSVRDKLMTNPLPLQIPIGREKQFSGVVDLLDMNVFTWDENDPDGSTFNVQPLDKSRSPHVFEEAMNSRAMLLESLASLDDSIGEKYVEDVDCRQLSRNDLIDAVRRLTLSGKVVPVLCGSALRNRGIQPLLDAVILFLPSPTEREHHFIDYYSGELSALAFKILHDKQKGPMTFLRLYSGSLESGGSLYNVNRGCAEKLGKLFQVNADEHREVHKVTSGNIVAVTGLKQTITGDTLVASHRVANAARDAYLRKMGSNGEDGVDSPVLAGMTIPDPVFFCSIEPPSMAFQKSLDQALECLLREDPSLRIRVDPDTGQTIIGGMGELHLEIIKDRILKEYGVDASFGPLQIAYRESVMTSGRTTVTIEKTIGNTRHSVTLCLSIHSNTSNVVEGKHSGHEKFIVVPDDGSDLNEKSLKRDHVKALESGITSGLSRGPLLGFPIVDVYVLLHDFRVGGGTSVPMISACTAQCLFQAAMKATPILLEPVMALEIYTDEHRLGTVLSDLSQRRSHILDIQAKDRIRIVAARTPLAELRSYASILRRITSGLASFSMELNHYEQMNDASQKKAIQSITGF